MNLENMMLKMSGKYKNLIKKIEQELAKYPEGRLYCKKTGEYYKWFHCKSQKQMQYIPKSNSVLASELAVRMIKQRRLADVKKEKYAIDLYLKHHNHSPSSVEAFLNNANEEMRRLISSGYQTMEQKYEEWQKEKYETNPRSPEKCRIRTLRGELVRSKSEAMIADYLYTHGIAYRYECKLTIGSKTIYPDFIIVHPITGEYLIIEHFGMMDDEEYRRNYIEKMRLYTENGYYPDINLICFYETGNCPLDSFQIAAKLEYITG